MIGYELSSKQKIFLYLYSVIPNLDTISYIYQLKLNQETIENIGFSSSCPRYFTGCRHWYPYDLSSSWKIMFLTTVKDINIQLLQMIMNPYFIVDHIGLQSLSYRRKKNYINEMMSRILKPYHFKKMYDISFLNIMKYYPIKRITTKYEKILKWEQNDGQRIINKQYSDEYLQLCLII